MRRFRTLEKRNRAGMGLVPALIVVVGEVFVGVRETFDVWDDRVTGVAWEIKQTTKR